MPLILNQSTEDVAIDALEPHPDNPNRSDAAVLADSIDGVGFYGFVVAQRRPDGQPGRILAGEHRWRAMRQLGAETIPVLWLDVDDKTAVAIMVGDNQHTRRGRYDDDVLGRLLAELDQSDLGTAGLGFDDDEIARLIARANDVTPPESPEGFNPARSLGTDSDDDDGFDDNDPDGDTDASDATLTVGEYRAAIPRHAYLAWRAKMRDTYGYAPGDITRGIFAELGLSCDVLPPVRESRSRPIPGGDA